MTTASKLGRRGLAALAVTVACAAVPAPALAAADLESTFQDDNRLIFDSPRGTAAALDTLAALGVDRLRVSVFWKSVAPAPTSAVKPPFDAADPAAYPSGAWDRYDQVLRGATARGMAVNFDITSPVPNWATGNPPADRPDIDETYEPDPTELARFTQAVGTRYSGAYAGADGRTLPRVDYWAIWNEPNQAGWLTPQWNGDVEASPRIYRSIVDATYAGLTASGHAKDTILVGETAPKGLKRNRGVTRSIDALRFIRGVYCLDANGQFEKGRRARQRDCPQADQAARFSAAHPGLFAMTGWSHHPYELIFAPDHDPGFKDWVTTGNLPVLSRLLKRIRQRYGRPGPGRGGGVPLYLTEYGYQTNPPDPLGVSLAEQAAYLDQGQYIAWRNPDVRTLSQFLLVDDKPIPGQPNGSAAAFGSFQSGLERQDGTPKPALGSYRMPVFLPHARVRAGRRLEVWGLVRAAPDGVRQRVVVEARRGPGAPFRTLATVRTDGRRGYLDARVRPRVSGELRLAWTDASGTTYRSRAAPFTVVPRR